MNYFIKLPKNYQAKINTEIEDLVGDEEPEISEMFRQSQAESLLDMVISETDNDLDKFEFGTRLVWFREGYHKARLL